MNRHKFPYKWNLKDGYPAKGIQKHGCKVFGTFVCGGGSTMGYKLAGYNHLGGVEIDPEIAKVYKINHQPKYFYEQDIRIFNLREDLPDELYQLDLLDGSPPCSSFSTAGNRDKDWGKKKKFREGQVSQRLDDLVFAYVDTIEKLKPKVALLENVSGMIKGNAKGYSREVVARFTSIGYRVQLFLLNAASMGIPQKRERVFFIGLKNDFDLPKLRLAFNEPSIKYGAIRVSGDNDSGWTDLDEKCWHLKKQGDKDYGDVLARTPEGLKNWNAKFIYDNQVCNTIASSSGSRLVSFSEKKRLSKYELSLCGSFPLNYDFQNVDVKYLIGMSVPPVMTAQIAHQIWLQWLSKL